MDPQVDNVVGRGQIDGDVAVATSAPAEATDGRRLHTRPIVDLSDRTVGGEIFVV